MGAGISKDNARDEITKLFRANDYANDYSNTKNATRIISLLEIHPSLITETFQVQFMDKVDIGPCWFHSGTYFPLTLFLWANLDTSLFDRFLALCTKERVALGSDTFVMLYDSICMLASRKCLMSDAIIQSVVRKYIELECCDPGTHYDTFIHVLENVLLKCSQEGCTVSTTPQLFQNILAGNPDYWDSKNHRLEDTVEKMVLLEEEQNVIDFIEVAKKKGISVKTLNLTSESAAYGYLSLGSLWPRDTLLDHCRLTLQKAKTVARLGYQLERLVCHPRPGDWTTAGWKCLMLELAKSRSLKDVDLTLPTSLSSNDIDESRKALQHLCQFKQAQLQYITLAHNHDRGNDGAIWLKHISAGLQFNLTDSVKPLKVLDLHCFDGLPCTDIWHLGPLVETLASYRCSLAGSQEGQTVSGDSTLRVGEMNVWEAISELGLDPQRNLDITAIFGPSGRGGLGTTHSKIGNYLTSISFYNIGGTDLCVDITRLLVSCLELDSINKLEFLSGYGPLEGPICDGRMNYFDHKLDTAKVLDALKRNSSLQELALVDVFFAGLASSTVPSRLWDCVEGHMALRSMTVIEGRRAFTTCHEGEWFQMDWDYTNWRTIRIISIPHSAKIQHACLMNKFARHKVNPLLTVKEFVGLLKNINKERGGPSKAMASVLESLLTGAHSNYYPLEAKDPYSILQMSVGSWCHRPTEAYQAGTLSILYDLLRELPSLWSEAGSHTTNPHFKKRKIDHMN